MRILNSSAGFTFLAALFMVVLIGIVMGVVGQSWKITMQREREKELLFRGYQYRQAIIRWHNPPKGPGQPPASPLNELEDLLKDKRTAGKNRYLRKLYKDPITGKGFDVLRAGPKGIVAVRSLSEEKPFKQGGFPEDMQAFEQQDQYKKWVFGLSTSAVRAQPGSGSASASASASAGKAATPAAKFSGWIERP